MKNLFSAHHQGRKKRQHLSSLLTIGVTTAGLSLGLPAQAIDLTLDNSANLWVNQALRAVENNPQLGPTGASRAYGILGTAMYDAWSAYEGTPISTTLGDTLQRPDIENTLENKSLAISYAAHSVLSDLFPSEVASFDSLLTDLRSLAGNSASIPTATNVGKTVANSLLQFRRQDGSNQLGNDPRGTLGVPYSDTTGYKPVNSSNNVVDITRWTPERVPIGSPDARLQRFLTPQWGKVTPFALKSGSEFRPTAPEPFLRVEGTLNREKRTVTLKDGTEVSLFKQDGEVNTDVVNPGFIEQAERIVEVSANLTDEQKLVAEFWEDPSGTPFPPGTWLGFGSFVSERDNQTLDQDIQLYFGLGNAVLDAGIATWEAKVFYDYTRPVRAIRELGELGLIGEFDQELGGFVIESYGGPGVGTIKLLASDFITYQTPGADPSPPFAEFTSGHSAFSAAAAQIFKLFTGSDYFGNSVTFAPGSSLFEPGLTPTDKVTLFWETFSDAADEAGRSRIYGSIHFDDGDIFGRQLGRDVGSKVYDRTLFFINGGVKVPEPTSVLGMLVFGAFGAASMLKGKRGNQSHHQSQ
ncbi:vanadium-dependent haloperoxidase [Moorena producens]|uniref:vanadium-dependent haloperoxidase n=1 Tax=Moorena producens TaxID=1155739 RepID=UPI003C7151CF